LPGGWNSYLKAIASEVTPAVEAMQRVTAGIGETLIAVVDVLKEETERSVESWNQFIESVRQAYREDHAEMSNSTPFYNRRGTNAEEIAPDIKADFSRRKENSSKGGIAAKENGTLHRFSAEEAARGGAKGGKTRASVPGAMSEMGKKGAAVAAENRRRRKLEREREQPRNASSWQCLPTELGRAKAAGFRQSGTNKSKGVITVQSNKRRTAEPSTEFRRCRVFYPIGPI
jgi:hypothetical protein